jgi:hypothetical protein
VVLRFENPVLHVILLCLVVTMYSQYLIQQVIGLKSREVVNDFAHKAAVSSLRDRVSNF